MHLLKSAFKIRQKNNTTWLKKNIQLIVQRESQVFHFQAQVYPGGTSSSVGLECPEFEQTNSEL